MLKIFQDDIANHDQFVVTLELVPGREAFGESTDTIIGIAEDASADGRISAVSITDNPGGNPSLSPDVLGYEIFKLGMDVIIHFTCRDMNRVGMESRALQLFRMGIKNILAITGDYSGKGFGGQGAPVFDLDSVSLTCMFNMLSRRMDNYGDPDGFFTGCAVSPFKNTRAECFTQYAKLIKKKAAGASFVITQLGYDMQKYEEVLKIQEETDINLPMLGSLYLLSPRAAKAMNKGRVPGAFVTDELFNRITDEWQDSKKGLLAAVERTAKQGVLLKKMGYKGIHIGGIHRSFKTVAKILDRMDQIEKEDSNDTFYKDASFTDPETFYFFSGKQPENAVTVLRCPPEEKLQIVEVLSFKFLETIHKIFFNFKSPLKSIFTKFAGIIEKKNFEKLFKSVFEDPAKGIMLSCMKCGDCGIQYTAFLCPESQCPKHTRNGPCGGSINGMCEVLKEKRCIWFRAYNRLASIGKTHEMAGKIVPPRMWELYQTSSWLNFHLGRDHQSSSSEIVQFCSKQTCAASFKLFGDQGEENRETPLNR